jgi:hypothetical protein
VVLIFSELAASNVLKSLVTKSIEWGEYCRVLKKAKAPEPVGVDMQLQEKVMRANQFLEASIREAKRTQRQARFAHLPTVGELWPSRTPEPSTQAHTRQQKSTQASAAAMLLPIERQSNDNDIVSAPK